MDKNLQHIEDLFRKALDENEEMPSENLWDNIDKILDKNKLISIHKKYTYLKKVVFLLMFFLLGLSIHVWKNRDNNNHEIKRNNTPIEQNAIAVKKPGDSLSSNAGKNWIVKNDKNILKKQNKYSGKTIKPVMTDNLSNSSIPQKKIKFEKTIKPLITNDGLNSTISKKEKLKENNPENKKNIKPLFQIEDNHQVVVKPANIDSSGVLFFLKQLNPLPVEKIKSVTTDLIETHSMVNNSKNIFKEKIKSTKPSRFFVRGFYSPDISFFHLKGDQSGNQNASTMKIENSETETFSSTVGALLDYKLSRRWSLQSGLTLSTTNINIDPETIYAQSDNSGAVKYQINTSSGYGYILPSFSKNPNIGDSIFSMSTTHTLQYLGIPLAVKYNITKKKFTINIMTGVSANFLTHGKITTNVEKGNNNETETTDNINGLKKFYFSGITGVGLDYNFYKNLSVCFSPTFRFALNSINKDVPVKSFPNSLGFSFGLKIRL